MIAQAGCHETIIAAARACQIPSSRVFVIPDSKDRAPATYGADGYRCWLSLLGHGEGEWKQFGGDDDGEQEALNTTAVLGVTSGTTGLPKAAALSHYYFVAQATLIQEHNRSRPSRVCQIPDVVKVPFLDSSTGDPASLPAAFPRLRRPGRLDHAIAIWSPDILHPSI